MGAAGLTKAFIARELAGKQAQPAGVVNCVEGAALRRGLFVL